MIIFTDARFLPLVVSTPEKYFILNIFNPVNLGTPLGGLFPPEGLLKLAPYDSAQFEQLYINYIVSNEVAFQDFLEIMMAYYYNNEVLILTDLYSPVIEPMIDCIMKLIQKRYGYICSIVESLDDLIYARDSEMSEQGFAMFVQDREWYLRRTVDPNELLKNIELVGAESDKCI